MGMDYADMLGISFAACPGAANPSCPQTKIEIDTLRCLILDLPVGVVVADSKGCFVFFNRTAERILGRGYVDIPLEEWSREYGCYLPDGSAPYPSERLPLARALRGETVLDQKILIRRDDGAPGVIINASAAPWRDSRGAPCGAVVAFGDVTARDRSAETIRRLSSAVEQTADAVVITDATGAIEYVNAAFEKMTGYRQEEVLGRTPRLLKSGEHEEVFYRGLWDTVLGGKEYRATIVNRRKDGSLFWAEQTITPMKDGAGGIVGFVSLLKDMTEKRLSQERESQILLAREVQRRFYRIDPPQTPGLEIAGEAFPAAQVGGDYFDFVVGLDGSVILAIGDVTGHGFGPALLMAEARAYTRGILASERDPGKILERINGNLYHDLDDNQHMTLFLARLDPGTRSLVYASAGHVPGFVLDDSGEIEHVLQATGAPLGLSLDSSFPSKSLPPLGSGRLLVLLTDGVTEASAPDGAHFGVERALRVIRRHRHESASRIVQALHQATCEFAGGEAPKDDVTCVICRTASPGSG
jgi:PAS domain S-box-containing protein